MRATITGFGIVQATVACRGDALGLSDFRTSLRNLDEDERHTVPVTDRLLGRDQETWVVNEPGLYSLILRSIGRGGGISRPIDPPGVAGDVGRAWSSDLFDGLAGERVTNVLALVVR